MKFNLCGKVHNERGLPHHMFLIMKLTALLLIICLHVGAKGFSQSINISGKKIPLEDVFSAIEKQSGYFFFYKYNDVKKARPVDVKLRNSTIEQALTQSLNGQPFTFSVYNQTVVITKKENVIALTQDTILTVRGRIMDTQNPPLPLIGVNVRVKGKNVGAITDSEGNFTLKALRTDVLVFSMIGYTSHEERVGSSTYKDIRLKEELKALSELVIVGYGMQKKANLTGAVNTVKSEDLAGRPATSVGSALQGQMPGVAVINSTALPGAGPTSINIRGIGTLNDSNPLIVVDGIPGGDLNILNMEDIDQISVLKDAASSSIYGVRGANGVILVTTKKGNGGKPVLTYNDYFGLQTPTALPKFLGSVDYMTMLNEAKVNSGNNPTYTAEQIDIARNGSDLNYYANTSWIDEMYKSNAGQQNHNLNLSGGANDINYYLSYGYLNQGGLITGDNYKAKRHNVRLRLNTTLFEILQLDANLGYIDRMHGGSSATLAYDSGPIQSAHNISPLVPVRFTHGGWGYLGGSANPVALATDGGMNNFSSQEITANLQTTLNVTSTFRLRAQYGLIKSNSFREIFTKTINYFSPVDNSLIYQTNNPNKIENRDYRGLYQTVIGMAEYEKTFARKHSVKGLVAVSSEENLLQNFYGSRTNLPTQDLGTISLGTLNQLNGLNEDDNSQNALQSFFGRLNYGYQDKYLLEGNFRYDGSTRFIKELRWNWFFSGSAAWVLSKESFFEPLTDVVNFAKIRVSYGTQGNDNVKDDFGYLSSISSVNTMPIGNVVTFGYRQTGVANRLLTWESMAKQNIGLDLALFNNKMNVTADYFVHNTNDILLDVRLPDVLGTNGTYPYQNAGKVQNKGWELMLGWQDKINDFSYGASANISDVKNEIKSMGNSPGQIGDRSRLVGYPIDAFYGFEAERISQVEDFSYDPTTKKYTPLFPYDISYPMQPGDIMFKDLNGDNKITAADDRKVIGNAIPRHTYGIRGNAAYKGFDFSFFLQGVGKADGLIQSAARHAFVSDSSNPQAIHLDRWTPENTNATYPRLAYGYSYNQRLSTFWLEDASYLRLKNVQFGYTLPKSLTEKMRMSRFRLYVSADNLLTKTNFFYGYDPETPVSNGGFYPQVKTFVFGLNINFK